MTPDNAMRYVVQPGLQLLDRMGLVPYSDDAAVLCHAICGQESDWSARVQVNGPARSYAQFEQIAVVDVMTRATSKDRCQKLCDELDISFDRLVIHQAMVNNDLLCIGMTRLNLWNAPGRLPLAVGSSEQAAWRYYESTWRPGKPRPAAWPNHWSNALTAMKEYRNG